jgi:hypothetical protein
VNRTRHQHDLAQQADECRRVDDHITDVVAAVAAPTTGLTLALALTRTPLFPR